MSNFFKRWSTLKSENTTKAPKPPDKSIDLPSPESKSIDPLQSIEVKTNQLEGEYHPQEGSSQEIEKSKTSLTMEDVKQLTPESDFSNFVTKDVASDVHQAAMKKLFSDPHFNVMDGLDIYIDDYSIADPIPPSMLEKMYQSSALGLFKTLEESINSAQDSIERSLNPSTMVLRSTSDDLNEKPLNSQMDMFNDDSTVCETPATEEIKASDSQDKHEKATSKDDDINL